MSKRYGRNQRRAHREQLASVQRKAEQDKETFASKVRYYDHMLRDAEAKNLRALKAARMPSMDTIRIHVDSLMDHRDMQINMRATMEHMGRHVPNVAAAINLSPQKWQMQSDDEREAFVKLVGESLAQHALEQIMRHWRSR